MPFNTSKFEALRSEAATLHEESVAVINAAAEADRDLTAEEQTANDGRFNRIQQIAKLVDEQTKFAGLALAGAPNANGTVQRGNGDDPGRGEFSANEHDTDPGDPLALNDQERARYARELNAYARTGLEGAIGRRFATITTTTASGAILPKTITAPIIPATVNPFRQAHAIHGVRPIETSTAGDLSIPVMSATAGGIVAENASSETENGAISESINLKPKTVESGSTWLSNQAIASNDFDIVTTILPNLETNKELALEGAIAAGIIADSGITQTVTLPGTTSAGLTLAKLIELNNKLPARYGAQKVIVLSDAAYNTATGLVGSDGHLILIQDPQNQSLTRFMGTPVLRSSSLEAFGASKCVGVIFSLYGFKLRDVSVQNLARYTNIPARPNQTGLNLFAYHGYGWAPSAVAKLVTSAS